MNRQQTKAAHNHLLDPPDDPPEPKNEPEVDEDDLPLRDKFFDSSYNDDCPVCSTWRDKICTVCEARNSRQSLTVVKEDEE